jgi:hypothetical protein
MNRLVVLHGISGTGKTSLALALEEQIPSQYQYSHPIGFLKNFIEDIYQLKRNSLELYQYKYQPVSPKRKSTFQDILVAQWKLFREHDPEFSIRGWNRDLLDIWNKGRIPVTMSLRNLEEVDLLDYRLMPEDQVLVIFLTRPLVKEASSDKLFEDIKEKLENLEGTVEYRTLVNDKPTLDEWVFEGIQVVENWRNSLKPALVQEP